MNTYFGKRLARVSAVFCAVLLLVCALTPAFAALQNTDTGKKEVNILFTHDIHDCFNAHAVTGADEKLGGYARLATAINENRKENTVVADGGDFSMGTVFQTVFESEAPTLQILGSMGYDAVTLGNHEFDYGSDGLAAALNSVAGIDGLPELLDANLTDISGTKDTALSAALHNYGAKEYMLIERGGVKIGIFGVTGVSAMSSATRSTSEFEDEKVAAERCVSALKNEGAEIIICLSHTGTSESKMFSKDEKLAEKVDGIDVIISGHTHTLLREPVIAGNTCIVSCGQCAERLGSLDMEYDGEKWNVADYRLIDIDSSFAEDAKTAAEVEKYLSDVDDNYMSVFGYTLDTVLGTTPFDFSTGLEYDDNHYNEPLGQFICDAQINAVKQSEGENYEPVDVGIVFDAAIRGSIDKGDITVSEAYNTRSIGCGEDDLAGDPLVSFYLSGKELKYLCECDASVAQFSPAAQIYMSGLTYTYSKKSMLLNRVKDVFITSGEEKTAVEADKLYRVTTCLYNLGMFDVVTGATHGLIKIQPKDKSGEVVTDTGSLIVYTGINSQKREVKEWYAVARYIQSFDKNDDGIPQISKHYNNLFSQRTELPHAQAAGWIAAALLLSVLAAIIFLIVFACAKACKKHKRKKAGAAVKPAPAQNDTREMQHK